MLIILLYFFIKRIIKNGIKNKNLEFTMEDFIRKEKGKNKEINLIYFKMKIFLILFLKKIIKISKTKKK